jgi:hypothetical protein
MTNFILEQAWISTYTDSRTVTAIQIPDKYPIVNVRIPYTMMNQSKPLVGSLVMVASFDNHKHYVIAVLREPSSTLNQNPDQILNSDVQFAGDSIQPGEVFLQAAGTPTQGTGNDAYIHITNSGTIELTSSALTEQIIIGGESSDDLDHENVIRAPNVFIESPITTTLAGIQSTFNFDSNNNIQIANNTVTVASSLEVPISEFTMDVLGNTILRNTTAGIDKSFLKLNATSDVQLGNIGGQLQFDPLGNVTLNGPTITLNNGTLPAARQTDSTFSSLTQDPTFWQFIQNLFYIFNLHTHISATPGNPTTPPITPLTSFPTQMEGIISSGSSTVKVG